MKSEHEIELEQMTGTLDRELEIFQSKGTTAKLTHDRLTDLKQKIKNVSQLLHTIDEQLHSKAKTKKISMYDVKTKMKKYSQVYQHLLTRVSNLENNLHAHQKHELLLHNSYSTQQRNNIQKAEELEARVYGIEYQAEQTKGIMNAGYQQLKGQKQVLESMNEKVHEIEHELTLTEQIMKVIVNREMMSKLILILLVFFLGVVDVMILLLKMI